MRERKINKWNWCSLAYYNAHYIQGDKNTRFIQILCTDIGQWNLNSIVINFGCEFLFIYFVMNGLDLFFSLIRRTKL